MIKRKEIDLADKVRGESQRASASHSLWALSSEEEVHDYDTAAELDAHGVSVEWKRVIHPTW